MGHARRGDHTDTSSCIIHLGPDLGVPSCQPIIALIIVIVRVIGGGHDVLLFTLQALRGGWAALSPSVAGPSTRSAASTRTTVHLRLTASGRAFTFTRDFFLGLASTPFPLPIAS